jgi:hypothetical protein
MAQEEGRPGVLVWEKDVLLLTREVARREQVNVKTVERWITEKGLPALPATDAQLGALVAQGVAISRPPHGVVYLIREADLGRIPAMRAYPQKRKPRERRGTTSGVGEVRR